MALFRNKNEGGMMDAIRCDEQNYLVWKWRPQNAALGESNKENAIRWGSAIRVKEGSVAVFIHSGIDGFSQDYIEGPTDTIVDTLNLPVLASLIGRAYNGSTPFQAEVYFINLAQTIQMKFAVPYFDVFDPNLPEYSVPVAVRGSIDFNINDYKEFIRIHRLDNFTLTDLQAQIKDAVIQNIKHIVENAPELYSIPVVQIETKLLPIKEDITSLLSSKLFADYGITLKDINIVGLEIDKQSEGYLELKSITKDLTSQKMKAQAKANIKDIAANQTLGVFGKAANMFADIKENTYARRKQTQREYAEEYETELAGRLGAAGAKIISAFGKNKKDVASVNDGAPTPPPLPTISYHVVMFGKPAGPYDMAALRQMAADGTLQPDTLVWAEGMDQWDEAANVKELAGLFVSANGNNTIPPIPKT